MISFSRIFESKLYRIAENTRIISLNLAIITLRIYKKGSFELERFSPKRLRVEGS